MIGLSSALSSLCIDAETCPGSPKLPKSEEPCCEACSMVGLEVPAVPAGPTLPAETALMPSMIGLSSALSSLCIDAETCPGSPKLPKSEEPCCEACSMVGLEDPADPGGPVLSAEFVSSCPAAENMIGLDPALFSLCT